MNPKSTRQQTEIQRKIDTTARAMTFDSERQAKPQATATRRMVWGLRNPDRVAEAQLTVDRIDARPSAADTFGEFVAEVEKRQRGIPTNEYVTALRNEARAWRLRLRAAEARVTELEAEVAALRAGGRS
jgi:hypothetical protein